MVNFKLSAIVGGGAFIISLLLCLLSGNRFPAFILKPFLFAIIFFALSGAATYFLSEMFLETSQTDTAPIFSEPAQDESDVNINSDVGKNINYSIDENMVDENGVDTENKNPYNIYGNNEISNNANNSNGNEISDDGTHYLNKVSSDVGSPIKGPDDNKKAARAITELLRKDKE